MFPRSWRATLKIRLDHCDDMAAILFFVDVWARRSNGRAALRTVSHLTFHSAF
jgi:hypothetical protein